MDKRIYIIGGLLMVLIIALVVFLAVRPGKKTTPTSNTIVIWDSFDTEENFSQIFTDYKAENKNIEIDFVKKNPLTFETDSINAFASGTGPDIWIIPNNWLPKDHDKLNPLAEKKLDPKGKANNETTFKNTYLPAAYQDNFLGGNVYGLPLFMDSLSLFYKSELFSAKLSAYIKAHSGQDNTQVRELLKSPPKTWDVLSEFVKIYGENAIALGDATTIDNSSDILTAIMLQSGVKMTSDDKTAALFQTSTNLFSETAYPGAKSLSFYTGFAQKDDLNYTWPAAENAYQAFRNNKVAMMIDYSRRAADIKKDTGRSAEIAALPQIKDTENPIDLASYQVMTVPKASQNQQKAWNLILYLASSPVQNKYLAGTKLASPRKDKTENSTDFLDVQNNYAASWYNPDPAKVEEIFKKAITQALGGDNPQTVLEGAAAEVTRLLGVLK